MLALKDVLPLLPMIAGLSANHLAALDTAAGVAPSLCRPRQRRGRSQCGEPAATNAAPRPASMSASSCRCRRLQPRSLRVSGRPPCSRHVRCSSTRPTATVFCRISLRASFLAGFFRPVFTPGEGAGAAVPRIAFLPDVKDSRACGLPERRSAGGAGRPKLFRSFAGAVLSRVAMAPVNYFPPPPKRAALHRETK